MLDDRLKKEEDNAISVEDVYDIKEIFENIKDCIEFINKETGIPINEIQSEFDKELNGYNYINDLDDYYIVYDKYVGFKTGRVAIVEFY